MSRVDRRILGRSGLQVSRIALAGSFGISADDTVRGFEELGVSTFFVTSRSSGQLEGIRRLCAAGHRDALTLIAVASIPMGFSVKRELASISKLLGVDAVDLFLLGWVQYHWYVTGKTWPAMRALKEEGRVRALGISCHDRPLARALIDELELDAVMLRYNAAHRGAEREVFATLPEDRRPGVIAYTATRWGGLLKPQGELGPMSPGECYRFALGHPAVDTVLSGARTFEELASNVEAVAQGPLPAPRLDEVKQFGDAVRAKMSSRVAWGS